MVRAILAPKSLEAQFIKRVQRKKDKGLVKQVLTQMRGSTLRICLCEDGRRGYASVAPFLHGNLQTLFDYWNLSVDIEIEEFSFVGDPTTMANLLLRSDLFYFAGVHAIDPNVNVAMRNGLLLPLLRERIQYNQCAYFGICGGAMLAGKNNKYDLAGLDIFGGLTVKYDCNVGAAKVSVDTSAEQRIIQITTGCAVVFIMDPTQTNAVSFATIKHQSQWWDFAERNTEELNKIIEVKMNEWQGYTFNGEEIWAFNLRGYFWIRGEMHFLSHARIVGTALF